VAVDQEVVAMVAAAVEDYTSDPAAVVVADNLAGDYALGSSGNFEDAGAAHQLPVSHSALSLSSCSTYSA